MRNLLPVSRILAAIATAPISRRPWPLRLHLLALVLAALLPALAGAGYAAWRAARTQRQDFETLLLDTARALALAVDREIEVYEVALTTLATSPLLDVEDDAELGPFHAQAASVAAALGTWIVLPDRVSTRQVVNTRLPWGAPLPAINTSPGEPIGRAEKAVFETSQPALVDTAIISTTTAGKPVAPVLVPVLRAGHVVRTLAATLNSPRMSRLLAAHDLRRGGIAGLADGAGRLLACSVEPERYVGTVVPSWSSIAANSAAAGLVDAAALDGRRMLFAFRRLARNPAWIVAVGEPWEAYAASWRQPLTELGVAILIAVALGAAAATWQARRLLHPLRTLAERSEATAAEALAGARSAPPASFRPPTPSPAVEADVWPVAEFEVLRHRIGRAEAALRNSEVWLRDLLDAIPSIVFVTDGEGRCSHVNRRWAELTGQAVAEALGFGWHSMVHPEDRERAAQDCREARARAVGYRAEYRVHGAVTAGIGSIDDDHGSWRWVLFAAEPRFAPDGAHLGGHFGTVIDITDRREAEARRDLLAREVDHRAKNVLAVVQAVLRLTREEDRQAYAAAVEGRVRALARAHTLLSAQHWEGADLRTLLEEELAPFDRSDPADAATLPQITLGGPPVMLPPLAVQPLGMMVHEMATNAAKHGALSVPGGRVSVSWSLLLESGLLRLRWDETGGPPVAGPPERRGFGTRMMEATMRDQLGGGVLRSWDPTGLVCEIELPLAGRRASPSARLAPVTAKGRGR